MMPVLNKTIMREHVLNCEACRQIYPSLMAESKAALFLLFKKKCYEKFIDSMASGTLVFCEKRMNAISNQLEEISTIIGSDQMSKCEQIVSHSLSKKI